MNEQPTPGFTPGPWRINDARDSEQCFYIEARHVGVATVFSDDNPYDEPNARLIAAAPDLYEALKRLLERAERELADPEDVDEVVTAKAVLAKADGRSEVTRDE